MNSTNPMQNSVSPRDVLKDDSRSRKEKEQFLANWRLDLLERVRATEENMVDSDERTDDLSDQLRQVEKALADLRAT